VRSLMTILFLLIMTACTSGPAAAPTALLTPTGGFQGESGPETMATSTAAPGTPPGCTCPPTDGSAVVCSCPGVLSQLPTLTLVVEPGPQAIPAGGITLEDNKMTFSMHPGERFQVVLGLAGYDWVVEPVDQSVLAGVENKATSGGSLGMYEAIGSGQAVLTATGNPRCRNSKPACAAPSYLFEVIIIVK
jgi:hypothetical protein